MAKQKKITIKGTEYTLQRVAPSAWLDMLDQWDLGQGRAKRSVMYPLVLENIVVAPKKSVDDFEDDFNALDQVVSEGIRFQQSKP